MLSVRWTREPGGRASRYVAISVACILLATSAPAQTRPQSEYEVKAAFLYNFARYIQWPKETDTNRSFVIGVIGKDPFGSALDEAVRGQRLQGRPVTVRRFKRLDEITDCDVLFVGSSESGHMQRILELLGHAPVLTVGDTEQFAERGGMINFTIEDKRVRFEMNVRAIDRAELKAGAQLLRLAKLVNDAGMDR